MAHLLLPQILNIPNKLVPLVDPDNFNKYRIFLLEGGRGGAKSHSVGRFLLYLNEKYKLRTVCGRETQESISESVHHLLSNLVTEYNLNYEVQSKSIRHREKGSEFSFIGLREQGRFNIQGLENVDILWIEEGQAVRKATMDVVLPTIRKTNSKIIVTMNRHLHNDPAYSMLVGRPDCLHININYLENEHCTQELINEADICKRQSEKDYKHIWLGEPLDQSEDAVFSLEHFRIGAQNAHLLADGYGIRVGGFDIARYGDDKCAVVILQQMGALHWEEIMVDEWEHKDLNYTTGRILSISNEFGLDGAVIDEDGLGGGPLDTLTKGRDLDYFTGFRNPSIGYSDDKQYVNPRTRNAYKVRDMLVEGHLHIKTKKLIDECLTLKYTFDNQQRRVLISKEKMRKEGVKSPNLADALIMAASRVGVVKSRQDRQYQPKQAQYAHEDNLFKIAGVM